MESVAQKLTYSLLYLAFLYAILYLLHTFFLHKLLIGNQPLRLKKNPDLPLRFRSDGTFKILQVLSLFFPFFSFLCLSFLDWFRLIMKWVSLKMCDKGGRFALWERSRDSVPRRVGV